MIPPVFPFFPGEITPFWPFLTRQVLDLGELYATAQLLEMSQEELGTAEFPDEKLVNVGLVGGLEHWFSMG